MPPHTPLGASRLAVMRMVFSRGGRVVSAGVVAGLVAAFFAVRIMAALLHGCDAHDLAIFVTVPVVPVVTALIATIVPAWLATRVHPIVAIRAD